MGGARSLAQVTWRCGRLVALVAGDCKRDVFGVLERGGTKFSTSQTLTGTSPHCR